MMSDSPISEPVQSLYIPRVHNQCYKNNVGGHKFQNLVDFIKYTFAHLDIATVASVDLVPLMTNGQLTPFSQAFVHLESWNPGATSESIIERIGDFEAGESAHPVRLVYDDPHYWILKPNKSITANTSGAGYAAQLAILQEQVMNLTTQIQMYQQQLNASNYSEAGLSPHSPKRRRKSPLVAGQNLY
tara:strand:- start:1317 stop:1877 length:561 start_codon:yes stop_codon:yes gene_type:complete